MPILPRKIEEGNFISSNLPRKIGEGYLLRKIGVGSREANFVFQREGLNVHYIAGVGIILASFTLEHKQLKIYMYNKYYRFSFCVHIIYTLLLR